MKAPPLHKEASAVSSAGNIAATVRLGVFFRHSQSNEFGLPTTKKKARTVMAEGVEKPS